MRRIAILGLALIPLAIVIAGCAPVSVSSHVDPKADFSRYHTFAWAPADALPTGDPRLDNNPFFKDSLQGAIERHLRDRGIVLAVNPAHADLLVHYHASVTQRYDVAPMDHDGMRTGVVTVPQVVDYDESTITIDMVDAISDRLVWRGWAQDSLAAYVNRQASMEKHIEQSVERMLARLPL